MFRHRERLVYIESLGLFLACVMTCSQRLRSLDHVNSPPLWTLHGRVRRCVRVMCIMIIKISAHVQKTSAKCKLRI
jgi:hypothetical protein